jgi:serpin B
MDDLGDRLTTIADSGSPRGADVIWEEARRRVRRRTRVRALRAGVALAAAIAVVLAVVLPHGSTPTSHQPAASSSVLALPRDATLARADVARSSGAGISTSAVVANDAAFGFDLYEKLRATAGNVIFSPQSLATALAMTVVGAHGPTASEMLHVLHASDATGLSQQINALDQRLLAPRAGTPTETSPNEVTIPGSDVPHDGSPARITIDNSMWAQAGYSFYKTFLDTIARYYGTGVHLVDYEKDPEAARVAINRYVNIRTAGKIPDLLPGGVVNPLTRFALVNTLTFKGAWKTPFRSAGTQNFHLLDGGTANVAMMQVEADATSGAGYQAVKLPYVGGASMTIVIPDSGHFDDIEHHVGVTLGAVRATPSAQRHEVIFVLPKFDFSSSAELNKPLEALGMRTAFSDGADFSNMTPTDNLTISHVIQDAHIEVDEKGTQATAATAVLGETLSRPPTLNVDRPFLFTITDDATGAVLFLGRVANPNAR